MSLATNITDLATRVATEAKALRTLLNGNAANNSALTTTAKGNLVLAINELDAEITALAGGGVDTLDELSDVIISSAANGHLLRHNGTNWVNSLGTTYYEAAGAAAAAQAASQPLDADLTDIAAVANQTAYGRAFLALVNQAGLVALLPSYQPLDSDLTAIAALSTTSYGRALLALADQAALMALIPDATTTTSGKVELATTGETTTGTDTTRAVTAAGVQAAIDALVASAPGTLNTLDELAAALGDDANYAATVTTSLAGKQPLDAGLTSISGLTTAADRGIYTTALDTYAVFTLTAAGRAILDDADIAAQRATLSVYSQAEIGDPATNFVTTFEAGLV